MALDEESDGTYFIVGVVVIAILLYKLGEFAMVSLWMRWRSAATCGKAQVRAEIDEETRSGGFQPRDARRVERPGQAPTSSACTGGGDVRRRLARQAQQQEEVVPVATAAPEERYFMARFGETE